MKQATIKEISDTLSCFGFDHSPFQAKVAEKYLSLILEWNRKFNLVSKNDEPRLLQRHFLDSLFPIKLLGFGTGASVLDVGSGAGFPAIPIKIMRPDLNITAVESTTKKAGFLEHSASILKLKKFRVVNQRLTKKRSDVGLFDYCIGRAIMELRNFIKLCDPFLKQNGRLYIFKHINSFDNEIKRYKSAHLHTKFCIDRRVEYQLDRNAKGFLLISVVRGQRTEVSMQYSVIKDID